MRIRVRDDEVGAPKRAPVDRAQRPRGERAAPKPAAVLDERVRERDERVEDDGSPARRPPRRGQVEMAGIADEDGIELGPAARSSRSSASASRGSGAGAERPLLLPSLPDRLVPLDHLDTGAAQAEITCALRG